MSLPLLEYSGPVYRPPSEADSLIIQATLGCSWNHCTYCAMYRHKEYGARPIPLVFEEIQRVARAVDEGRHSEVKRVFLADGDALALPTDHLRQLLDELRQRFPKLSRISCYATAQNLLDKSVEELTCLRDAGLRLLYIGPESGDDATLKAIAKGATFADHQEGARRAHEAGLLQSLIFLLGAAGEERSDRHAEMSGQLTSAMDPRYVSLLTVTVIPNTPLAKLEERGKYRVPEVEQLLQEIALFLQHAEPSNCVFRSNHASNYLPLSGRIPRDTPRLLDEVGQALRGERGLRPEWMRGL